ncbi:MAG TPA: hypothetical protein VHI11_07530 [Jiangellaceae bacterium]|jgi:hypothetical protein|nr:hypothetical protein [Jiangellaceae bacterium]
MQCLLGVNHVGQQESGRLVEARLGSGSFDDHDCGSGSFECYYDLVPLARQPVPVPHPFDRSPNHPAEGLGESDLVWGEAAVGIAGPAVQRPDNPVAVDDGRLDLVADVVQVF